MGRIIVNKHFDEKSSITPGSFAHIGEIIISNQAGSEGIFIKNTNGEIFYISTNGLASESFVMEKIAEAKLEGEDVDLSIFITEDELNDKGFLTEIPKDSIREIALEEVLKIVDSADTSYDTLREISEWIKNDTTGAASMANDIANLKSISADTRISAVENKLTGLTSDDIYDTEQGKTQSEINQFLLQGNEESSKHFFMSTTQYAELVKNGSVIIDDKEFIYDENAYYALYEPDEE